MAAWRSRSKKQIHKLMGGLSWWGGAPSSLEGWAEMWFCGVLKWHDGSEGSGDGISSPRPQADHFPWHRVQLLVRQPPLLTCNRKGSSMNTEPPHPCNQNMPMVGVFFPSPIYLSFIVYSMWQLYLTQFPIICRSGAKHQAEHLFTSINTHQMWAGFRWQRGEALHRLNRTAPRPPWCSLQPTDGRTDRETPFRLLFFLMMCTVALTLQPPRHLRLNKTNYFCMHDCDTSCIFRLQKQMHFLRQFN